jgi:NDP-sugar pyrophosphorylase family protein
MTYPVAVLAGGLGTRLRDVTGDVLPKALVPVRGRPFLDWKLEELARQGATQVALLIGHGADEIRAHVGNGSQFGVEITYVDDGPELRGTGGALLQALPLLGDPFWVTYGDTLLDLDVAAAEHAFGDSDADMLMTVLHNADEWEPSNVVVDGEYVVAYSKDPTPPGAEYIDYGMLAFRKRAWGSCRSDSFDVSALIATLVAAQRARAFEVTARFYEIGSAAALEETERYLATRR